MQESDSAKLSTFEQQLDKNPLPVLNSTLRKVREKLVAKHFNYEQLGSLIYHDPMYMFNFLACANRHKQDKIPDSEEKIKNPKHASMLLGITNIKKCISSLVSLQKIKTDLPQKDNKSVISKIEQLACRSLHCAYQAKHLAQLMHSNAEEEIFHSALMMSLAELLVWHNNPQQAQKYELLIHTQSIPETEAQLKVFGFSFNDLIFQIAPKWQLPELYLQALKTDLADETQKSISCIKIADKLSRYVDFGWYYQAVYDHIDYCALITPFSAQRLAKEFHLVAAQMSDNFKDYYPISVPISALLLEAGKIPYYAVFSPEKNPAKEQQDNHNKTAQTDNRKVKPIPQNKLENATTLPTLIQLTINYLYQSEKFDQVVLLLLDKSKSDLTIRIEKTKLSSPTLQKKINVSQNKNLFSLLLQKPQPIFFKTSEAESFSKLLTTSITDVLPAKEFFAQAIYFNNKPIGIIYLCNQNNLDSESYSFFRKTLVRFEKQLSLLA
jgi:HD-like signal output (HDOD) protein